MNCSSDKKGDERKNIETDDAAWAAFERAVDVVVKAPPMHRSRKRVVSFNEEAETLLSLLSQPTCPRDAVDSAAKLIQRLDKCLFVKVQVGTAPLASEGYVILQPSDLFLRYMAAFRARDWPLVSIIEHEATS
jgi:hypothetical protein